VASGAEAYTNVAEGEPGTFSRTKELHELIHEVVGTERDFVDRTVEFRT
jgi:hypothetical protein